MNQLSGELVWLVAFIGAYWAYCIYWGVAAGRLSAGAGDFMLADRRLPPWVFVVTATAMSFSAWTFLGQPAFVFRDGLPFSELSLGAVVIPLTGVLFLKRQWLLGKRFGYVTPGDMFADYFESELLPLLVLVVALVFAIPFVSMQLSATSYLVGALSGGAFDSTDAMWVMTGVVFLYVCLGGIRGTAYVGTLQGLLLGSGMIAIGLFAYVKLGGPARFDASLAKLAASHIGPWGVSAKGDNGYFVVPGVIQFTAGLGHAAPVGGFWTSSMILSYALGLMGIQASPAFTMWGFSARTPKSFGAQQVWASAGVVGLILVLFAIPIGMGAHFLGASHSDTVAGLALSSWLGKVGGGRTVDLIAAYIQAIARQEPWLAALLALSAVAAAQVMIAAFAVTTGSMLSHDLYKLYINPKATDKQERLFARIGVGFVIIVALLIASYLPATQGELGALALGFGLQLCPALAGICWFPWITRQGAVLGLLGGLAAVVLTEPFGAAISAFFGFHLPWGRWPWTIYSGGWGLFVNVAIVIVVSIFTQKRESRQRRLDIHGFLRGADQMPPEKRPLKSVAWALTLGWIFFAVGPGVVIGNRLLGAPARGIAAWRLGVPSLWAWQGIWWALGVFVIWFLAYKMEMSTVVGRSIEFGDTGRAFPRNHHAVTDWRHWVGGVIAAAFVLAAIHWMFG